MTTKESLVTRPASLESQTASGLPANRATEGRNEAYSAWHVVEDLPWRAVGRIGAILSPLLGPRTDRPLGML
ncbi:MAG: hypothetical protein KJN72_06210, partial [Woeseia sp.]|nr:hypothetical protein [Woeseia sp.]